MGKEGERRRRGDWRWAEQQLGYMKIAMLYQLFLKKKIYRKKHQTRHLYSAPSYVSCA